MHNFEWSLPTRIVYGPGQLSRVGELVKPYGRKVLLVTYQDKTGLTEVIKKAIGFLQQEGLEVSVFDRIEPNPRTTTVDAGVKELHKCKCDVLVAIGGGEFGLPQTLVTMAKDYPVKIIKAKHWHPIGHPEDIESAEKNLHKFIKK